MTDSKHRQHAMNKTDMQNDALDRELDVALAQFAAAEPRAGLEDRVLANLRLEEGRAPERSLWRWPALSALAAVLLVTVSLMWRSAKPKPDITVQAPPKAAHFETQVAGNRGGGSVPPHQAGSKKRVKPSAVSHTVLEIAPAAKLDQFPSPQPLSEQEKILADYAAEFQEQAVLIARFNEEDLRRDRMELVENAQIQSE
jgi:hypothetical protein